MSILVAFIVFMLGASVGSFVNVMISRSVEGKDWVSGRSKCDFCHKTLPYHVLIPVFSFLLLGGKTHCCKKKLSIRHLIVEILFGVLFAWWLLVGFLFFKLAIAPWSILQPLFWLGIGILLLIIAVGDAIYGVILMPFIYIAAIWIYGYRSALALVGVYQVSDLFSTLAAGICSFVFLGLLRWITKGRGMGDGDPYLAFVTGSLLSGINAIWGMLWAFVLGAIWGVGLIMLKRKKLNQTIAFGPFLILGCLLTLLFIRF